MQQGGRPTLVVGETLPFDITEHVMIAWNGSLQASRAVLGAMSLLHVAGRASIFAAPQYEIASDDAVDLADSLRWHGIRAHHVPGLRDENSTGRALGKV